MNTPINESSLERSYETRSNLLLDALSAADSSRSSVPLLAKFFEGRKYEYIYEKSDGEIALFSDFPSTSIYSRVTTFIKFIFHFNDSLEKHMNLKKLSFSQIKTKVEKELDDQSVDREIRNKIAEKFRALIDRFELKPMGLFAYLFFAVSTEEMKSSRIKEASEARAMLDHFTTPNSFGTPGVDHPTKNPRSILSKKTPGVIPTPAKQVRFDSGTNDDATPPAHPYWTGAMTGLNTAARRDLKKFEEDLGNQGNQQDPWNSILCSPVSPSGSPTQVDDLDLNKSPFSEGHSDLLNITGLNLSAANISFVNHGENPDVTVGDLSRDLKKMCSDLEEITGKPISSTSQQPESWNRD